MAIYWEKVFYKNRKETRRGTKLVFFSTTKNVRTTIINGYKRTEKEQD